MQTDAFMWHSFILPADAPPSACWVSSCSRMPSDATFCICLRKINNCSCTVHRWLTVGFCIVPAVTTSFDFPCLSSCRTAHHNIFADSGTWEEQIVDSTCMVSCFALLQKSAVYRSAIPSCNQEALRISVLVLFAGITWMTVCAQMCLCAFLLRRLLAPAFTLLQESWRLVL